MKETEKDNDLISTLDDIIAERFSRYAKYIIQDRALPDVRDGLKPVQRRILYAMGSLNLTHNNPYKKSARVLGEVVAKYHPHGDSSIYAAMVRLSQYWKLKELLVDMHGNNGSIDDDPPAAYRYTEARLTEIASVLLQDIEKETVLFAPNFDDSEQEPTVLPARFPNLLVNGSTGIAAGYATNIPPHNLGEVIDAIVYRIDHAECNLKQVQKFIKGPDFPTGGIIQGVDGINDAYKTGKGKIVIRSTLTIENNSIVISQIPFEVIKQDLVKKIDDIHYNEPALAIKEVRDETDRTGLRIVIELNNNSNFKTVRKYLFKHTNLQVSYNFNMIGIDQKQPKLLNLLKLIDAYIVHQKEVTTKRSRYDLKKAEKRLEIIDGLIKAISVLDEVIAIIRQSKDRTDSINNLISRFNFTLVQAEAIVQLRLYRLSSTDIQQLQQEKIDLNSLVANLKNILADETQLNEVIKNELLQVKKRFATVRKSKIENDIEVIEIEKTETIIDKDVNIWISKDGYLKLLDSNQLGKYSYDEFKRKPNDLIIATLKASSLDKIVLFTSKGNYVIIPVYKIKPTKWKEIGEHVNTISQVDGSEKILACFLLKDFNVYSAFFLIATKMGMIKKVAFNSLEATRISKAIKTMNLKNDDEVVAVNLFTNEPFVWLVTKNGFIAKYNSIDIAEQGLKTAGVKAINLKDDDYLVYASAIATNQDILLFTDQNGAKRLKITTLPLLNRPVKGVKAFSFNKKRLEFVNYAFAIKPTDVLSILKTNDEIEMYNTRNIKTQSLADNVTKIFDLDVADITIENYYDLKDFNGSKQKFEIKTSPLKPNNNNNNNLKKLSSTKAKQAKKSNPITTKSKTDVQKNNTKNVEKEDTIDLQIDIDNLLED